MCDKYKNNAYPTLWIFHFVFALVLCFCVIRMKNEQLCKRLMICFFMGYHIAWGVGDLLCYTGTVLNEMGLFVGVYCTTLIYLNICHEMFEYFRCCCCRERTEPLLDTEISHLDETCEEDF